MSVLRRAESARMALARAVLEIGRWNIAPHGGYSDTVRVAAQDALALLDEAMRDAQAARELLHVEMLTADAQQGERREQEKAQAAIEMPRSADGG